MDRFGKELKIEIKVDERMATGTFSNYTNITHTHDEFIADFLFVNATPPPGFGKLISRIILTPRHAKRILLALTENITMYEKKYGEIKAAPSPDKSIKNLQ